MSTSDLKKIREKLNEVLSRESGNFGRICTWGQTPANYEYIGYELDSDILPTLETLSDDKRKNLVKIISYFEIHANPLRKLLEESDGTRKSLHVFYSELAWSHFMTVIMFGMLEVAIKSSPICIVWKNQKLGQINKIASIQLFLETFLSQATKNDIAKRYRTEDNIQMSSFSEVVNHLWKEIRSGFVHEAGIHYKGMELTTFVGGMGSREDPIRIGVDVPMQELLQITWQAILSSYGYKGRLILPEYR